MHVIVHNIDNVTRSCVKRIYALGDFQVGHPGVQAGRIKKLVDIIEEDPDGYWIDMGDKAHLIRWRDKRFDPDILPSWMLQGGAKAIKRRLIDIPSAQRDWYLDLMKPIAPKCIGMLMGNHELAIRKYCERGIHAEMVDGIRVAGDFDREHQLDLGYSGWVVLNFSRYTNGRSRQGTARIKILAHHGPSTADYRLRDYALRSDADIVVFGHSHKLRVEEPIKVRALDRNNNLTYHYTWSGWTGTAQEDEVKDTITWGETKGHLKTLGCIVWEVRPYACARDKVWGRTLLF